MAKKIRHIDWPVLMIAIVVSIGIGFFMGRIDFDGGEDAAPQETKAEKGEVQEAAQPKNAASQMSPEQLAKEKGVPVKIESGQGNFVLVAVVEGGDANRALRNSLQVVNAQRQRLAQLSRQYDQTAPAMAQQRELIAGQINETSNGLKQNLRYMAQNFGYVISNNYLLVPHRAALNSVIGEGKDQIKTVVYSFKDALSYENFQKKTDAYTQLKRDQLKEYRATQTEAEKRQPLAKLPLTQAMEKARKEMIDQYKCDPERNYLLEIQKSALYGRKAR